MKALRKPDAQNKPAVGDWILPTPYLRDGIVNYPRRVHSVSAHTVTVVDTRAGASLTPSRMMIRNIAYIASSERVAIRAFEMSELAKRRIGEARVAARNDIEAIEDLETTS